jgi:hypothetical protein
LLPCSVIALAETVLQAEEGAHIFGRLLHVEGQLRILAIVSYEIRRNSRVSVPALEIVLGDLESKRFGFRG